jgi:hypothetical protein
MYSPGVLQETDVLAWDYFSTVAVSTVQKADRIFLSFAGPLLSFLFHSPRD